MFVQFERFPLVGVPRVGVTKEGEFPKLVSDEDVTPDASVDPVNVPAAAVTVISAVPLNETPLMFLAVCNDVAVPAFPDTDVWSPVFDPLIDAVPVTESVGVEAPDMDTPLTLVAVAAPMFGVTSVGEDPKLVRLDEVTPEAKVAPVSVPASAVTVIFAVPSNDTPLIVLAVCRAVAVPALPVTDV